MNKNINFKIIIGIKIKKLWKLKVEDNFKNLKIYIKTEAFREYSHLQGSFIKVEDI